MLENHTAKVLACFAKIVKIVRIRMDRMEAWRYNQDGRVIRFAIGVMCVV